MAGHEPSVARPGRGASRRDRAVVGTAARACARDPAADARRHAARRRAGGRDGTRAGASARRARAGDPHFADGGAACATGDRSAAGASPAEGAAEVAASRGAERAVVAIGPEGGWVPFEIDLLRGRGFTPFTLGPRPLRVEVALPYALGMLRAR